jgi:hypothetical protein
LQQAKIDSLQNDITGLKKGYDESKIGKEFFHSVITSNMTMYTSIIAIFILLVTTSVGYFTNKRIQSGVNMKIDNIRKVFADTIKKQEEELVDFKSKVTKRMKSLVKEVKYVRADVSRSVYMICIDEKIYANAFSWSSNVLKVYLAYSDFEDFIHWLSNSLEALELTIKENDSSDQKYLKEREEEINKIVTEIINLDNKDFKELAKAHEISEQIKTKFNQFIWSDIKEEPEK